LLNLNQQEIPALISNIKNQINNESDPKKIRVFRTMIGMAEDAYQLKILEDIMDFDTEIQYEKKPIYNSEQGIIYKNGKIFTADFSEDETEIIVRDIEGILVDRLSSGGNGSKNIEKTRATTYKNWNYLQGN
jgi:ArsR family metal-binding transcriptional regulator